MCGTSSGYRGAPEDGEVSDSLGGDPGAPARGVEVLGRAAAGLCLHQLDRTELAEDAEVIRDLPEIGGQQLEDLDPQGVRASLSDDVDRNIQHGFRAPGHIWSRPGPRGADPKRPALDDDCCLNLLGRAASR